MKKQASPSFILEDEAPLEEPISLFKSALSC